MFILGELFRALALLVDGVSVILYWLLVARIVVSYFPVDPYHGVVQFLYQVTEPILAPLRKVPLRVGMLDLTPILAFVFLIFLKRVLVGILLSFAQKFGMAGGVY